jgi:hypothetical protein
MRTQIKRLSPHQNGKVFAVLSAVSSLLFVIPFMLIALFSTPQENAPPFMMILFFPVIYLFLGYVMVAVGCWVYNFMFKYVGGIEFEPRQGDA